jgi:hypothetical protein
MAKLIEEIIVIKLSKLVKDSDADNSVLSDEQRAVLAATAPALVEEVINDSLVVVELAELS